MCTFTHHKPIKTTMIEQLKQLALALEAKGKEAQENNNFTDPIDAAFEKGQAVGFYRSVSHIYELINNIQNQN